MNYLARAACTTVFASLALALSAAASPTAAITPVAHTETCHAMPSAGVEQGTVTARDLMVRRTPGPMPAGNSQGDLAGWLLQGDRVTRLGLVQCVDEAGRSASRYVEVAAAPRQSPSPSAAPGGAVRAYVIAGWTSVG